MRTSNKLLLAFAALVVLLMLSSDILLWANFKKGISGDEYLADGIPARKHTSTIKPFKVVKLKSEHPESFRVDVEQKDDYQISYEKGRNVKFLYSQLGDTLYVDAFNTQYLILYCPDMKGIIVERGNLALYNAHLRELYITVADSCRAFIPEAQIGSLHFKGGKGNQVSIAGKVDSLFLELGKDSRFTSYDVLYKYAEMKLDSLIDLDLKGRSLWALKKFN